MYCREKKWSNWETRMTIYRKSKENKLNNILKKINSQTDGSIRQIFSTTI